MNARHLLPALFASLLVPTQPAPAEQLLFIATLENGVVNYSWFGANNWYKPDNNGFPVHVGRIPTVDDDVQILTDVNAAANTIVVKNLIVKNATVNGGNFQVPSVTLTGGSTFVDSTILVSDAIRIGGTDCLFDGAKLTIQPGAFALFEPIPPATTSSLSLANDSLIANFGDMILKTNSLLGTLVGSISPTNRLQIHPNAKLRGGGSAKISGVTSGTPLFLENSGTIQSEEGLFTLASDISWSSLNSNCVFKSLSGTTLNFLGSLVVPSNLTFVINGPGLSRAASLVLTVNGKIEIGITDSTTLLPDEGHLELAASADGAGQIHVRSGGSISNSLTFSGGGILSVNEVTVDNGANFIIEGSNAKIINGTIINNSGNTYWRGADNNHLTLGSGMSFHNLARGAFTIENNAVLFNGAGFNAFNNAGTFQKISGGGTSQVRVPFTNSASVAILNGAISFQAGFVQTAGTLNLPAGSVMSISGGSLNLQGGKLSGNGLITGPVVNGAKISPGDSPGILTFAGGAFSQTATGNLAIEIGGTISGTQYDQLVISNSAALGGAISVQLLNNFVPTLGQQFEILKCTSRSGAFAVQNGMLLPNGLVLVPVYSATNVMLVASNITLVQPLLTPTWPTAMRGFSISWPTLLNQPYHVEYSPDLENWYVLTNVLGSGSVTNITDPTLATNSARYYRVR